MKNNPNYIAAYHISLLITSCVLITLTWVGLHRRLYISDCHVLIYSVCFGAIGGSLCALRYLANAVKRNKYKPETYLWHLLNPLHSGVIAVLSVIAVKSGILGLVEKPSIKEPQYTFFIMILSFAVGYCSEVYLKKLILAVEYFLGERHEPLISDDDDEQRKA